MSAAMECNRCGAVHSTHYDAHGNIYCRRCGAVTIVRTK